MADSPKVKADKGSLQSGSIQENTHAAGKL